MAKYEEMYSKWDTPVEGKPLHEWVALWMQHDEKASEVIGSFSDISEENYRTTREVERMVGDGSFFPGNHKDFKKLPKGLACTTCPAFYGVTEKKGDKLSVMCEWPNEVLHVQMQTNPILMVVLLN